MYILTGLTPAKIVADLEACADVLRAKGADVKVILYDPNDFNSAKTLLLPEFPTLDVIEIGAGVRTIPKFLIYFENLVNFIHEAAPKTTKVCFNTNPSDCVSAIERWL